MSKGRLTRQELGWLLTQEAQGAAERLRKGVQVLRTQAPEAEPTDSATVDDSLDALDDVMRMLSNMHQKSATLRRGRIDVAALLWEISPDARVQIEPGGGTEVFGEESELRRMLHVLLDHAGGVGSAIAVRGDGDEVRLSIALGPDTSPTAETERAWLSRMAIRYGGKLELEGGHEILTLRSDDASDRSERERLTKELDAAKKQGAAVARELAQLIEHAEAPDSILPPAGGGDSFSAWLRLAAGVGAELRAILAPIGPDLAALREHVADERLEPLRRRLSAAHDLAATLAATREVSVDELPQTVDLVDVVRQVVAQLEGRAERHGVRVERVVPEDAAARLRPKATAVLVRELVSQAIAASPKDGVVKVTVEALPGVVRLSVSDEGASLPAAMRGPFVRLEVDASAYGRASAVPLHACVEIAQVLQIPMEFGDAPSGLRVSAIFSR